MSNEIDAGQPAVADNTPAQKSWDDSIAVVHSTTASDGIEPQKTPEKPAVEAPTEDDAPEPVRKKPTGYLRKLGRAEAERDAAREELQRLREQVEAKQPAKVEAVQSDEPKEPDPSDFNDYASYTAAVRKFDREQGVREAEKLLEEKLGKRDAELKQTQEVGKFQQTVAQKAQEYTSKLTEYEAENPGTQERIKEAEDAGLFPDHLVLMTLSSQAPVAITSYLANNIDELQAINQMNPQQAQIAFARLEGKLEALKTDPVQPRQTQANPPIKPAKPGTSGSTRSPHELSLSDLDKRWKPLN